MRRIPVGVEDGDDVGASKVDALPASACGNEEHLDGWITVKIVDHLEAVWSTHGAIETEIFDTSRCQVHLTWSQGDVGNRGEARKRGKRGSWVIMPQRMDHVGGCKEEHEIDQKKEKDTVFGEL